jgi:hypothetical protein
VTKLGASIEGLFTEVGEETVWKIVAGVLDRVR